MDQDNQQRRVKNVNGTAHRTGVKRAAVKPGNDPASTNPEPTTPHQASATAPSKPSPKTIIDDFMGKTNQASLSQVMYGSVIDRNAAALAQLYGLAQGDDPYLLVDITPTHTGRAGMLLSESGIHLADGRGGTMAIAWSDLPRTQLSYQRGMLVIGQAGISTRDAQTMLALLQQIQSSLS